MVTPEEEGIVVPALHSNPDSFAIPPSADGKAEIAPNGKRKNASETEDANKRARQEEPRDEEMFQFVRTKLCLEPVKNSWVDKTTDVDYCDILSQFCGTSKCDIGFAYDKVHRWSTWDGYRWTEDDQTRQMSYWISRALAAILRRALGKDFESEYGMVVRRTIHKVRRLRDFEEMMRKPFQVAPDIWDRVTEHSRSPSYFSSGELGRSSHASPERGSENQHWRASGGKDGVAFEDGELLLLFFH